MRAREEENHDTKDRILDAAEALFARKGFDGARAQEIADRANVDKKLLFYYFINKKYLYREVIRRFLAHMGRFLVEAEFTDLVATDSIRKVADTMADYTVSNLSAVKIILREMMEDGVAFKEVAGELIPATFETAAANLKEQQARGEIAPFDPRHFMINFGGMIFFYYLTAPFLKDVWGSDPLSEEARARQKEELARLLLDGIRPKAQK